MRPAKTGASITPPQGTPPQQSLDLQELGLGPSAVSADLGADGLDLIRSDRSRRVAPLLADIRQDGGNAFVGLRRVRGHYDRRSRENRALDCDRTIQAVENDADEA